MCLRALARGALCLAGAGAIVLDQFPAQDAGAAGDAAMTPASAGMLSDVRGVPLGGDVEVTEFPVIPEPRAPLAPAPGGILARDAPSEDVTEFPVLSPAAAMGGGEAGFPGADVSEIPVPTPASSMMGEGGAGFPPAGAGGVPAASPGGPQVRSGAGAGVPMDTGAFPVADPGEPQTQGAQGRIPVEMGKFPGAGFDEPQVQSVGRAGAAMDAGAVGGRGDAGLRAVGAPALKQDLLAVVPNDKLICYQGPPQSMKDMLYRLKMEGSELKSLYSDVQPLALSCAELGFVRRIGQTCYGNTFAKSYNMAAHFSNENGAKATFRAAVKAMGITEVPKVGCVDCKGSC